MSAPGSVTCWISLLKAGDPDAAQPLWEHYWARLVRVARDQVKAKVLRGSDEDDLLQEVWKSFFERAAGGHFPRLKDRNDLWHLLVRMTVYKACRLRRAELADKRFPGQALQDIDEAAVVGREPEPDVAALAVDELRAFLRGLGDEEPARVALWHLEGYGPGEIAVRLTCSPRTVHRRLEEIHKRLRASHAQEEQEG